MTDRIADPARGAEVVAMDRAHVFHSWSAQQGLSPLPIAAAEGSYFWDYDGRRYLDFSSQLVNTNIGHQHPKVTAAIAAQAARLATIAPQHANEARGEAATRLAGLAPAGMEKVFFTNGGADANENAIRMARLHTGRAKVLSFYRSYHGNTGAAIASTGDPRRWPNEFVTGHVHFFGPYLYRSAFWATTPEQECERALQHLEQVIQLEGPATIAAVLLETIVGTAGVLIPPPGYLAGVRALCDRYGIVYIADEVMCGFGRAGSWFAFEQHAVVPDLITFAKGSNSGYVPIGGVIISDQIAATFDERVFPGGLTYSGHPLGCASIVATIDAMREEGIVDNSVQIGNEVLGPGLRELADRHPVIGEVRGLAVFWALDLVANRETREMLAPYGGSSPAMNALVAECRSRGLMPFTNYNRLHVVPPCTVTESEAKEGLAILDEALAVADRFYQG
ncbi:MAG TPA: aspartate aminotransferase family protein [Streptosporangiaceae bacterium]|nr:aspartate aminotransferase family protein [Streptosporangiaceae bacterium]